MDNILQIIIPAYNAKDTIDISLSSIAIQRTDYRFSVLIVNDKSDYDYSDFIKKYSNFFNVEEIILDENSGPGVARQVGIDNTSSKYIIFLDADDYFYSPYSINSLIKKIETENCDLVISDFIYEKSGMRQIKSRDCIWLHGKIYRRSFLEKYSIRFNNTRENEDNGFNSLLLLMKPNMKYLFIPTYVYNDNPNSTTRRDNMEYRYSGLKGYADNLYWVFENAKDRGVPQEEINYEALKVIVSAYYYYLELFNEYDVLKIFSWFKKIYDDYYPKNDLKNLSYVLYLQGMGKKYEKVISYDEFIKKMEEVND